MEISLCNLNLINGYNHGHNTHTHLHIHIIIIKNRQQDTTKQFIKCFNRNRNQHHHRGRYYRRKNHGHQLEPYRHSINNVRTQSINLDDENEPDDVIIDILDDRPLTYFVFPMGNKTISPATPPSPRLVTFKMADAPKRRLYRPLRRYRQKLTTIVEMGSNEI